jgi:uncharacterized protein
MKLYREKIPAIAADIIKTLCDGGDIVCETPNEAQLDTESVLTEYVRMGYEITDLAKDRLSAANLPFSSLGRFKKAIADEKGFSFGEDGVTYMSVQLVELFLQSNNIDEIFADDYLLRKKIEPILKKHMSVDDALEAEVRRRIKNLDEGTMTYDIEFREMERRIKSKYKLE